MGLFTTKTRRTYYRPQAKRGWSTTLTAKTRLKRWFRRGRRKLWRTTKQQIRRRWKKYQRRRQRERQHQRRNSSYRRMASQPTSTSGGYQVGADGAVSYQAGATTAAEGQAKPPPPDGAISTCRRCSNEVIYSAGNGRWEHPGRGSWECFQPHRD